MTVACIVATFGDKAFWDPLADRALASIQTQTHQPDEISRVHGNTLHEARNEAVRETHCDWVIVLDADDELHPEYLAYMVTGEGDVRIPSVQIHYDAPPSRRILDPFVIRAGKSLQNRNHVPIGAMFRREAFDAVGGFEDYPIYEDWALWCRMWIAGYQDFQTIPQAIYKAHARFGSRNSQTHHAAAMVKVIRDLFDKAERSCATSASTLP